MKNQTNLIKSLACALIILLVISMLSLHAQDYLISFAGTGGSTTVDSVIVENLTTGPIVKMKGSDVLHLKGTVSIFETNTDNETGKIIFYPNPMKDYVKMQFVLPKAGETMITLYDPTGKEIVQTRDLLSAGEHTYSIQGIEKGIYFASVISDRFSLSGKLISTESKNGSGKITYESSTISQEKSCDTKGTNEEKVMQYNTGDRLKLIGISGNYSTIVTDVPTASTTITYNFIACTDGDGNNYPVVQIGTTKGRTYNLDPADEKSVVQTWMAENLKTTKLQDGSDIPQVADRVVWGSLSTPACCWYENNSGNKDVYGALYNWYTVSTGKLCPVGWHVPTISDWEELLTSLGGFSGAGEKLKEKGNTHWIKPNYASNETGFTALPGGFLSDVYNYYFANIKSSGFWWTSAESSTTFSWDYAMSYSARGVSHGILFKRTGISVRCVMD